jgi:HEAT repeats
MILRSNRPYLFVGIVALLSSNAAFAQTNDDTRLATARNRVEPLLRSVAADKKLDADAPDRIPDLIVIVDDGDIQESELAIRALASMGSKASPAIAAISKKLDDPSHATRSTAADALVAIGDKCVDPMRKLLNSPSARTRASATYVLSRLKALDSDDLVELAKDPDPRVRAATMNGQSKSGKPGVKELADMLQDPDLAVAIEAARGLQSNREDASIAVPQLTKALARADLAEVAVNALSAYGVEARQAVPAIIKAFPLGPGKSSHLDATEEALTHIGPPSVRDIPVLCESLRRDGETRMVVAHCLGLLGLDGKLAADALEAAAETSIKEHVKQRAQPNHSGRTFVAAEDCVIALWDVTHDSQRFLRLIEKLAIAADAPIFGYYAHRAVLKDLSPEDCRVVEKMLRHSNVNVQRTALAVLSDVGPKAEPLKKVVLELAQGKDAELSRKAILALAVMGAKVGNGRQGGK